MKQQGDQISDATLRKLGSEGIDSIQLNEYSKGKKLVLHENDSSGIKQKKNPLSNEKTGVRSLKGRKLFLSFCA